MHDHVPTVRRQLIEVLTADIGSANETSARERRLARAGLLYADTVVMLSASRIIPSEVHADPERASAFCEKVTLEFRGRLLDAEGSYGLVRALDARVLRQPYDAGPPGAPIPMLPADDPLSYSALRFAAVVAESLGAPPPEVDGLFAAALLGELEVFPDASVDVLLDVRDRLEGSRVRFRAAVADATKEMHDIPATPANAQRMLADLRLRVVDPALAEIREELEALGARRTLLRVAKDRMTLASAGATVSMVAGAGGVLEALAAVAQGAAAASLIAAGAAEANFRADAKARVQMHPYWLLHEVDRELRYRG
jgi:hypothetical protein